MDSTRFDTLVKSLSSPGTRRDLMRRLAPLPLAGLLATLLPNETEAGGRRKRRKKRNKHRSGDDKDNRKGKRKGKRAGDSKAKNRGTPASEPVAPPPAGCQPESAAQTCTGTCARVANNCGTVIDCGACTCATGCHPVCQTCNPDTGLCDAVAKDTPCDDGDACTVNDVCTDGVCGGSPKCGGGQGCTQGRCCLLPTDTSATKGLQEAINQSKTGDILNLCAGTWNLTASVLIDKNLTLVGAGADATVLDGNNAVGVLRIEAIVTNVTATLQDLTIRKGKSGFGGGIYNYLGTLTLLRVNVTGNTASLAGGGIYNDGAMLTLEDGSVIGGAAGEGNTATYSGGGIYNNRGTITMQTGSRVTGNTATNSDGGIFTDGGMVELQGDENPSPIVVNNCRDNCAGSTVAKCAATPVSCP